MSRDDEDDCCTGLHLHDARVTAQLRSSKVQSSLTGSRQCAFHRATDEPCAVCITPMSPKGWFKTIFFTYFRVAFHIFVAGNHRHFKFGMPIDHSKSQPTDDTVPKIGVVTSRNPLLILHCWPSPDKNEQIQLITNSGRLNWLRLWSRITRSVVSKDLGRVNH